MEYFFEYRKDTQKTIQQDLEHLLNLPKRSPLKY